MMAHRDVHKVPVLHRSEACLVFVLLAALVLTALSADRNTVGERRDGDGSSGKLGLRDHPRDDDGYSNLLQTQTWSRFVSFSPRTFTGFSESHPGPSENPTHSEAGKLTSTSTTNILQNTFSVVHDSPVSFSSDKSVIYTQLGKMSKDNILSKESDLVASKTSGQESKTLIPSPAMKCITHTDDMILPSKSVKDSIMSNEIPSRAFSSLPDIFSTVAVASSTSLAPSKSLDVSILTVDRSTETTPEVLSKEVHSSPRRSVIQTLPAEEMNSKMLTFFHPSPVLASNSSGATSLVKLQVSQSSMTSYSNWSAPEMRSTSPCRTPEQDSRITVPARPLLRSRHNSPNAAPSVSPRGNDSASPYAYLLEDSSVIRLRVSTGHRADDELFLVSFGPLCDIKEHIRVVLRDGSVLFSVGYIQLQKLMTPVCRFVVASYEDKPLTATVSQQLCNSTQHGSSIRVRECGHSSVFYSCTIRLCDHREMPVTYSQKGCLQIALFASTYYISQFELSVSSTIQKPDIKVEYVTESSGFISSPLYNGNELCLLSRQFTTILAVPLGNVAFLSIDALDPREGQCLTFRVRGTDPQGDNAPGLDGEGSWSSCDHNALYAKVFKASLSISFYSTISSNPPAMDIRPTYGFKVKFSFHLLTEIPQLLESEFFDCSKELNPNVRGHLECNFRLECQEEEDETNCPFSSSLCESGFEVDGQCYKYWVLPYTLTWNEAHVHCRSRGGRLIILNTLAQLKNFTAMLTRHNIHILTYIGLRSASVQSVAYRNILQWYNSKVTYNFLFAGYVPVPSCVIMSVQHDVEYMMIRCDFNLTNHIICQFDVSANGATSVKTEQALLPEVDVSAALDSLHRIRAEKCPRNHIVLDFLICDSTEQCGFEQSTHSCQTSRGGTFPMFVCHDGYQTISFTSVCDRYPDCQDKSDEVFCDFHACPESSCHNGQCVSQTQFCDGMAHCVDQSDENPYHCMVQPLYREILLVPDSFLITQTGFGSFSYHPWSASLPCPTTHFRCLFSHCLPVYLMCNGIEDCPNGEDEEGCDNFVCPGFYKCQRSKTCLHPGHVCDGVHQCPFHDDELYCGSKCPVSCRCQGLAFACTDVFMANEFKELRFLDATGSGITPSQLSSNAFLVYLNLRNCGIGELHTLHLPNLRELDLSYNNLTSLAVEMFNSLKNLRMLSLSWNPLALPLTHRSNHQSMHFTLETLLFAGFAHEAFEAKFLSSFPGIEYLNLSHGRFESIDSLSPLAELKVLDVTGSPINSFPVNVFEGLSKLKYIYTDNYKMCCSNILPQTFNENKCYAPEDEISSCDNLFRLYLYRICLWLLAFAAIAGNCLTFVYRVCRHKSSARTGFGMFVTNLSVSDLLMGIYLALIGAADQMYLGTYSQNDERWRQSWVCKTAGFLSLLSSEVSALTICLITLDRFIVLRFPFSSRHFKARSAAMACGLVWVTGLVLAAAPLLPATRHWQFYGQNSICIPLPITSSKFHGQVYSYSIMIVLNSVLFMLVAAGQIAIFCSIRTNSLTINDKKRKSRDMLIAKRLAFIVVTDFMCWFPVGLLGILAAKGFSLPREISVAVGIFVLPLNSALNPFLYTLNTLIEQRRERAEQALSKELESKIRIDLQARYLTRFKARHEPGPCFDLRQILDTVESNSLSGADLDLIAQKIKAKQAARLFNREQQNLPALYS